MNKEVDRSEEASNAAAPPPLPTDKAARLAAIRAANAQKKTAEATAQSAVISDQPPPSASNVENTPTDKAARLAAIRAANAQKAASGAAPTPVAPVALPPSPSTPGTLPEDLVVPMALSTVLMFLFGAILGAFAAVVVLPSWLPGLTTSLAGSEPKAYWYLSRSSGLVAYILLWLSTALGLTITSKLTRLWNNGPTVLDVHQHTSLLALAFGLFHALILLGDGYMNYTLVQVLMPFGSQSFRPVWVGLGQVALYLLAVVGLSFYVRDWIGRRAWRLIHYLSFVLVLMALMHGIGSGTDTAQGWIKTMYWATGGSLVFLTIFRVLVTATAHHAARPQPRSRP